MNQTILTFITKVKPDGVTALAALLDLISVNPEANIHIPFRSLQTLHFASLVLHESAEYGTCLVFENNFDGGLEDYLLDLYAHAGAGIHLIYSFCQDYSVSSAADREGILSYLRAHVIYPNAYHIGNTGRGAQRILQERDLRTALEDQCDHLPQGATSSVQSVWAALQQFVRTDPRWSWAIPSAEPREPFAQKFAAWSKLLLVVALVIALIVAAFVCRPGLIVLVAFVCFVVTWFLVLRFKESQDDVQLKSANAGNVQALFEKENHTSSVQNHMASITIVKPGWLRRSTLRIVLWAVNLLARVFSTTGTLSGIPSIHFAHWSMIDNGRRLLFLSNFDGSWENYLDDFIDKASHGLTGVWSNTINFPRTYFLIFGGATDGPRFKAVARNSQIVTNVWYSAYWDQTVQGIDNSSSIREDLLKPLDPASASALLQRL